jgi:hypothetical protein
MISGRVLGERSSDRILLRPLPAKMSCMKRSSMAAREKWTRIIEEQRASGLAVARFCEERRIPASSIFPWRKRLKDTPAAPAFGERYVNRTVTPAAGSGRSPTAAE